MKIASEGNDEMRDDSTYTHVPLKPAFTVQVTYKHVGKLKPRQFPTDDKEQEA